MTSTKILAGVIAVAAGVASASAASITLNFDNLSGNSATNAAIGESQFKVTVSEVAGGVNFRFFHDGSAAAAIARIYFDDRSGRLAGAAITGSGSEVKFGAGGAPPVLPSGANAAPAFVETLRFTANSPPPKNGISPGEHLDIKFALNSGDFNVLMDDISSGALRLGFHAISFANGGSETFVNGDLPPAPVDVIPLPTPLGLTGAGLLALAAIRRRR